MIPVTKKPDLDLDDFMNNYFKKPVTQPSLMDKLNRFDSIQAKVIAERRKKRLASNTRYNYE